MLSHHRIPTKLSDREDLAGLPGQDHWAYHHGLRRMLALHVPSSLDLLYRSVVVVGRLFLVQTDQVHSHLAAGSLHLAGVCLVRSSYHWGVRHILGRSHHRTRHRQNRGPPGRDRTVAGEEASFLQEQVFAPRVLRTGAAVPEILRCMPFC